MASAGITFGGFNNIDFSLILNAIMTQESQPVVTLQARQKALQAQQTAFSTLASKLTALESASKTLSSTTSFGARTATSTNSAAVAVSASSAASVGSYDIVVTELAKGQTTASTSTFADKDTTTVASAGALVINGITVAVTVPATLQDLADAINANDDVSVSATVVSTTPGSYQLVLTGKASGSTGAFTVQSTLSGGPGVAFADADNDGISGDSATDNAQNAINAAFTLNNIAITSSKNTITDAIAGVTFTLLKKDPTTAVGVSVTADQDAAKTQVKAFVTAFNELIQFAKDQSAAATKGEAGNIGRDALLRGLRNELRGEINREYATGGTYSYLSQVGIGFNRTGTMTFDETAFDAATKDGNGQVMKLFAGSGGVTGVFASLQTLVTNYTDAGGLVPDAKDRISQQLTSVAARIDAMNARLAIRRESLNKEFIATDQAMSTLNDSIKSLTSLDSQYRLF
jgi:flagellar hook-associated protein 2